MGRLVQQPVAPCAPRLLEPIGTIPPAEAEANYYAMLNDMPVAA